MSQKKTQASPPGVTDPHGADDVVLIGDVVASRRAPDRLALHDTLVRVIEHVNGDVTALDPLVVTVGDEFQGRFATLGDALAACFGLRLRLAPAVDVRFGLGRGATQTLDARHGIHDGPAYWAARSAIERTKERASRAQTRTARTTYEPSEEDALGVGVAVQSALDCLDLVVGSLSTQSTTILGGLMDGRTQHEIAADLAVSPSAVSQRVRRDGLGVAVDTMTSLSRMP
ncbi:SatD family protein [Terracoccus luteus]|uniref:SatD family protein n=1 Tax=Terracoccus luteus TaxID=53356 RepID=A0A839PR70_9MICO|nr:SatD family protein [Terracoccus luteus]MBB2985553.1 hypothetical protein [Terracoccus luteus]MCP2171205.1 hypothetical protein [Terracoccus luteus]